MRIAIITCYAYRDAWSACLALLDKFWPAHPPVAILTDDMESFRFACKVEPKVFVGPKRTWCERVAVYAGNASASEGPVFLIQEDMFLKKPVDTAMINYALKLLESSGAGLVRVYPSPAGTAEMGDPYFAEVPYGAPYRISCHAALWRPQYLAEIAMGANWTTGEARDFENLGTPYADTRPELVVAIKEGVDIPFLYHCTGISRGLWDPNAIKLCEEHNIPLDLSLRGVAAG